MIYARQWAHEPPPPILPIASIRGPFLLRGLGDNFGSNFGTDFSSLALPNPFDSVPAPATGPSTLNLTICTDPTAPGCTQAGNYGSSTRDLAQNAGTPQGHQNGDPNARNNSGCFFGQMVGLKDKNCKWNFSLPWWAWAAGGVAGVLLMKDILR